FVAGHDLLIDGWRWLLIVGSLGAVVVWLMRRNLPESPRWYEMRGDHEAADRAARVIEDAARRELGVDELPEPKPSQVGEAQTTSMREILEGPYRKRSLMLWIFQFLQTVGYYGFGTLAPLVLAAKGYDIVDTLGFTAIIFLGYPLGSALSVPLMDRFERKHLIIASALGIGFFGLVFGFARTEWLILLAGFCTTSVSNVSSNSFHIYQAEIFPTRIRGTAVGTAYSLSRLSGAILPFITVSVLDHLGATAVFTGSAAIMVLLCIDIGLLGPRSTGMKLDDSAAQLGTQAQEGPRLTKVPRPAGAEPAAAAPGMRALRPRPPRP